MGEPGDRAARCALVRVVAAGLSLTFALALTPWCCLFEHEAHHRIAVAAVARGEAPNMPASMGARAHETSHSVHVPAADDLCLWRSERTQMNGPRLLIPSLLAMNWVFQPGIAPQPALALRWARLAPTPWPGAPPVRAIRPEVPPPRAI